MQTADKKVLIEVSDADGDDFDSKSQSESQSSNTNIIKLETFASSRVERLDTSQNQLKLQSNGKPAKKSETQVFKQGKNRDGSSNSSFKTDEDMQDYNFEEDKEF